MTLTATPILGIPLMAEGALQKEVLYNEAVLILDAAFAGVVIDQNNTPPVTPADGDVHIVGTAPTGAWAGKANDLALYYNGWIFITPPQRMQVYNLATPGFWSWNGTAWAPGGLTGVSLAGLTDATLTSPTAGQPLVYNGSKWTNSSKVDLPAGSLTSVSGSITIDRNNGEVQRLSITGNVTATSVTNWPAAGQLGKLTLEVQNTGAFTFAWPAGVKWSGGVAPTVTSGAGAKDIYVLMTFDGGTTIYGNVVGQAYS